MKNIQKVFITCVTGKQGGAVARNLINSGIELIGLTRSKDSAKAIELQKSGVNIIEGDMDKPDSFSSFLEDIDVFFLVQAFEQGAKSEIEQAKKIIDLACDKGVNHLVYSSVMGADLNTGIPHFDSKYVIEKYIHLKGIDYTILRPASFNENYLNPEVLKRLRKGKLVTPLNNNVIQQLISTEDVGKIASQVIQKASKYKNRTISIATDEKSIIDQAKCLSEGLNTPISYQKLPGIFTLLFMGKDLYKMFAYMNKNNFVVVESIDEIKKEFEGLGDLDQWIHSSFKSYF